MIDQFPILGNHLTLDFLNTEVVVDGKLTELLPDATHLAAWLGAVGLLTPSQSTQLAQAWAHRDVTGMERLWELRDSLRSAILQVESGKPVPQALLDLLNRLLLEFPRTDELVRAGSGLARHPRFAPKTEEDVLGLLASSAADLLASVPADKIRKCKGCVCHFYDTSKKGARIWCSTALCGNRAKVAAFALRNKAEQKK